MGKGCWNLREKVVLNSYLSRRMCGTDKYNRHQLDYHVTSTFGLVYKSGCNKVKEGQKSGGRKQGVIILITAI